MDYYYQFWQLFYYMANTEYSFKTLAETAEGIYTEKGSKFIGISFSVSSEIDFKKNLK